MVTPLVQRGVGIGVVTELMAREALRGKTVFEVMTIPPLPAREVLMVTNRKFAPSAACREFISFIEQEA